MHIDKIRELILSTQEEPGKPGHLFEVTFYKKDGTRRTMRARLGVSKHVTGKGMAYDPDKYNLQPVWEGNNDYRMIPLDRLVSLRIPDGSKHLKEVLWPAAPERTVVPFAQ
jgi:hypothetical protein